MNEVTNDVVDQLRLKQLRWTHNGDLLHLRVCDREHWTACSLNVRRLPFAGDATRLRAQVSVGVRPLNQVQAWRGHQTLQPALQQSLL